MYKTNICDFLLLKHQNQACPKSGVLWCESIDMASRPMKRGKSRDALKACGQEDFHLSLAVAILFANERKKDKARKWFIRAVTLQPNNGDGWTYYYKFELLYGDNASAEDVLRQCQEARLG